MMSCEFLSLIRADGHRAAEGRFEADRHGRRREARLEGVGRWPDHEHCRACVRQLS
jgi:hypothetical protein